MANAISGSVIVVDTTGAIFTDSQKIYVVGIKYIGAASGTATLKSDGSSGQTVWEEAGTANVHNHVEMYVSNPYVTLGSGAKVYIYTEVC